MWSIIVAIIVSVPFHLWAHMVACDEILLLKRAPSQNVTTCDEQDALKAENCATQLLMIGRQARSFPTQENQMKPFCRETDEYVKCYKEYITKCQAGFGKQVSSIYLHTVTQQLKQICKRHGRKRAEYIRFGECGNAAKAGINSCMDALLDSIEASEKLSPRERVAVACCNYYQLISCSGQAVRDVGAPKCTADHVPLMENIVSQFTGNAVNLVCGVFEDSEKCDQVISSLPKSNRTPKKSRSFVQIFNTVFGAL